MALTTMPVVVMVQSNFSLFKAKLVKSAKAAPSVIVKGTPARFKVAPWLAMALTVGIAMLPRALPLNETVRGLGNTISASKGPVLVMAPTMSVEKLVSVGLTSVMV